MIGISAQIQLVDAMTNPLMNIIDSINMTISAFQNVDESIAEGFDATAIHEARIAADLAANQMEEVKQAIKNNADAQNRFNNEIREGNSLVDGFSSKIIGMVTAYASFQGARKMVELSDSMSQTTARLNMMNDGSQTTAELQDKIFASAQRSRAGFLETAAVVAKLGIRTKGLFNNDEVITFAETLNKSFVVAGASIQETQSASLQLTQALGSGVLRGEELNAVFEAAPNIIQTIADYMNVPIGQIRDMAKEGMITSEIVKNALLSASGDINKAFEDMPMTWSQVWIGISNEILYASQPILEIISMLAQNWSILEPIVFSLAATLGIYIAALGVYKGIKIASAIAEGIHAASMTMASGATFMATAAQHGFNAALLASPITWVVVGIMAIVAAVYAFVAWMNKAQGETTSATGVIMGSFFALGAGIWNIFLALFEFVLGIINSMVNPFVRFANFIGNVFTNPVSSIIYLFQSMADSVLATLERIATAMDFVFGSNMASSVAGWRAGLKDMADAAVAKYAPNENYNKIMNELDLSVKDFGLDRWGYKDAFDKGYKAGEGIDNKIGEMFGQNLIKNYPMQNFNPPKVGELYQEGMPGKFGGLKDDVSKIADNTESLKMTEEDLKYLRDIAERDIINRFTTAEVKVSMSNTNHIASNLDIDGIVHQLTTGVEDAMAKAAEGVHK